MSTLEKFQKLMTKIQFGQRDDWENYFMSLCYVVSLRSTCGSRRVGAVLIDGIQSGKRRIIATGYNGYPSGALHCMDGGCPRFVAKQNGLLKSGDYTNEYPCDAFHAEANCLFQVINSNVSSKDSVMFTTTFPCLSCARKMNGAQIKTIYYTEGYPDQKSQEYLSRYGMRAIKIEKTAILKEVIDLCESIQMGERDGWEEYFMALAYMSSLRSKSKEIRDGAILVSGEDKKRIIATGYNGYPATDFPDESSEKNHPEDIYSAAENALNQMLLSNSSAKGAVLYTTRYPSFDVAVSINGAGIEKLYYCEGEEVSVVKDYFKRYNIKATKI